MRFNQPLCVLCWLVSLPLALMLAFMASSARGEESLPSRETLAWLRGEKFRILTTRVDAAIDYAAASYSGRTAIVLGSEARGLTDVWRGDDITPIKLPMLGQVDSLNLSATAAVLFYEALRQSSA